MWSCLTLRSAYGMTNVCVYIPNSSRNSAAARIPRVFWNQPRAFVCKQIPRDRIRRTHTSQNNFYIKLFTSHDILFILKTIH